MRKRMLAIILGVLVFSLVAASAASLGGVRSDQLGADAGDVTSCDTDGVSVEYALGLNSDGTYDIESVQLASVNPDCDGQDVSVSIATAGGTEIAAGTGTVSGTAFSVSVLTVGGPYAQGTAELAGKVSVAISGAPVAP